MIPCPSQDDLRQFLLGESPRPLEIADHLAACESCRIRIRALSPNAADPLADSTHASDGYAPERLTPFNPLADAFLSSLKDYEILHEIHRGGQGVVYKAIQKSTKRTVAVKVLLSGLSASEEQRQRFEREINLAASIQHPGIVTIYESGLTEQRYFYAMEYVAGQTLDA
ncbi:MAG TPA: protein kinase, partial [Phycisphaerales bacterium]|nr:protein kinase [Phycisphaerales bacterium]